MSKIKNIFIAGVKFFAPLFITVVLILWVFTFLENFFKDILLLFINPAHYFVGLGWIFACALIFFFGLLTQLSFLQKMIEKLSRQIFKLPLIKTVYNMSSDMMKFFTKKGMHRGKIVKIKTSVGNVIGIMTQDELNKLPEGIGSKEEVAVYIPMSYQIGGYTLIVPKTSVTPVEISVQEGMTLTLTAFIAGNNH